MNRIYELGAEPSFMPVIDIQPPLSWEDTDRALDHLDSFRWLIFTSSNGVEYFLSRLWKRGGDARSLGQLKIAAIGPGTAAALHPFGLRADLIPKTYRAEGLAAELKPLVQGAKVLWVRANRGRDLLNHELIQAGADLQEVIVYRNEDLPSWPPEITSQLERNEIDWIPLSSPSIARNVARLLPKRVLDQLGESPLKFASISPITTAAAISAGLPISAEATLHTWDGLLNAIITSHAAKSQP